MDDRAHRRLRRRHLARRSRAGPASGVAALRHQVVHLGDDVADGAHARAPRGQPRRAGAGSRSSTSSAATPDGSNERHRRQPPQGQARHAQGADRGAHARRHARDAGRRARRTASATSRRCSTSRARGTRSARVAAMRRGLALARDYAQAARRVRRAARATSRSTSTRSPASQAEYEGAFHPRVPRRRAARHARRPASSRPRGRAPPPAHADREAHAPASRRSRSRARCSRRSAARATSRTPACRAPARRAGAPDLGGHDERALARRAPRDGALVHRGRGARRDRGRDRARDPRGPRRAARRGARSARGVRPREGLGHRDLRDRSVGARGRRSSLRRHARSVARRSPSSASTPSGRSITNVTGERVRRHCASSATELIVSE